MYLINDFAAALAVSQLALLSAYFFTKCTGTLAKVIALYCICLAAYTLTLLSFVSDSPVTIFILFRFATFAPLLLWYISFSMFVDNEKINTWVWVAMAFCLLARGIGMGVALVYPDLLTNVIGFALVIAVPQFILLYFSASTLYLAWVGHRNDLVEQRRRVSILFVGIMGVIVITIVGTGFINLFNTALWSDWVSSSRTWPGLLVSLYIFLTAYLFNLAIFRINDDALTLLTPAEKADTPVASVHELKSAPAPRHVARLNTLMQDEKLYVKTGLTIAELAEAINMQEYRLRRLINQEMGYRNFNQFLNNYRIEDAQERLLNSESSISNIALDVGYASLSVFNKAFKERYNVTPREYRAQQKSGALNAESPA